LPTGIVPIGFPATLGRISWAEGLSIIKNSISESVGMVTACGALMLGNARAIKISAMSVMAGISHLAMRIPGY